MAVLTTKHKVDLVKDFIDTVESSENSYYCFVGKATPWLDANGNIDETNVIPASDSIAQTEQEIYKNIVYGKRISNSDVSYMIVRYNWNNGDTYFQYDNEDDSLYNKQFYVITDTNDVYKCIYNGYSPSYPNGTPSIFKPSINQTSGNFQTPDGYIWKYMYTCNSSDYSNFQTPNFIPISENLDVKNNAIPGTIDNLVLLNTGNNYQVYETGFLNSVVNNYVVKLNANSSSIDNYYTGSSIYLKAGAGAGQIRKVSNYEGDTKILSVTPSFEYNENLKLSNINGTFSKGLLISQNTHNITYLYKSGYFNENDVLIQSDTAAQGIIRRANTTAFVLENVSNTNFSLDYTVFNSAYSAEQKTGTVNITNNSVYINSAVATTFTTDYSSGNYIRVGENANNNIRRIVSVNTTVIQVDSPFYQTIISANNYMVNNAITIDSITRHNSQGSIVFTNLNSAELVYSNVTPEGKSFIIGETVSIVDAANTSQNSNGIISFSNSSTIILTDVKGNINQDLYLYGLSSQTKAYINSNDSYPNITVDTIEGNFYTGVGITAFYANGVAGSNAMVVSNYTTPSELTEYIISPSVNIEGDGNGALAYCRVDLSENNSNRGITSIILIDGGKNYTRANVSISANTLYGTGSIVKPQISPVNGHGSNVYSELIASYCGISKKFGTAINEGYNLPMYGSYRNVGIIKNPEIEDAIFEINNFDRVKLKIANTSGTFESGEIAVQTSSNSAGVVVYSNTTFLELKNVKGTFLNDSSNTGNTSTAIYGWTSGANTYCTNTSITYFTVSENNETILDASTGAKSRITQVISNTMIRVSNVVGVFLDNDYIYEAASNTYANVSNIFTSNGTLNSTSNFGLKFNQTARLTLSSNTNPFELYEYVTQDVTFATGRVISNIDEIDIIYNTAAAWAVGDIIINSTTGSNAVVSYANTTSQYLKLTAINNTGFNQTTNRPFNSGDTIRNLSSTKTSTINTIYNVLVLDDVNQIVSSNTTSFIGNFQIGSYTIVGNTSGSVATVTLPNSIKPPTFVRESGEVIYLENISKFDKSPSSTEQVKLIIKF
jgi:hypothetical protein